MAKTIRGRNSRTSAKLAARGEKESVPKNGITDSALKLARENDIPLSSLTGSGQGGRVLVKDVRKAMNGG